jgi:membrane protease YdiL (CAAX protease family)
LLHSPNPWVEPSPTGSQPFASPPDPVIRDPSWTGWDVLRVAFATIGSIIVFLLLVASLAHRLLYPGLSFAEVSKDPLVTVIAQFLAYLVVLAYMMALVERNATGGFWSAIHWNWPRNWLPCVIGGLLLAFGLQAFAHFLPMPKELPIDRFFQTPAEAWILSLFGATFAPLIEELFFRGFLYPLLARRLGIFLGVVLTAAGFGLIHSPQLGRAWAPILVVFLVGLALTITRAVTNSVAAGVIIHMTYNATLSVLIFVATGGFRHFEKLTQ